MRPRHLLAPLALTGLLLTSVAGLPGAYAASATCAGVRATIVGTSGNDLIRGTSGRDVIAGLGGDDRIYGLGGDDLICGGGGADRLYGGAGADRLYGGTDEVQLDRGGTYLVGDTLVGGPGDDYLAPGHDGRRTEQGGTDGTVDYGSAPGPVSVDLGAGTATGDGTDHIVNTHGMVLQGSPYDDTLTGSSYDDTIRGMAGDDTIRGLGGDDALTGEGGAYPEPLDRDRLYGGDGDDELDSDAGADVLVGNGGDDTLVDYSNRPERLLGGDGNDDLTAEVTRWSGLGVDGGSGTDTVTFYDRLPSPGVLTVDRRHGTLGTDTPATSGTLGGVERYFLVTDHLSYRYLGTDAVDRVWDYTGGRLAAWTYGGDDRVYGSWAGRDHLDLGAGDDYVSASARSTCLNWERGTCG